MATTNRQSTGIFRPPTPAKVRLSELKNLISMLEATETSLVKFGKEVSGHPMVLKQLLRAANSSMTGSAVTITEPAHAALFLGSRRVTFLLNTLPPEIIEDDLTQPDTHE